MAGEVKIEVVCLNCGKITVIERKSKKFCSGKCRAEYSRKNSNKKKDVVTKFELQTLYNEFKSAIQEFAGKVNYGVVPTVLDAPIPTIVNDEPLSFNKLKEGIMQEPKRVPLKRTPAHWVELRRDCENADDYAKWIQDLDNDPYLNSREKAQIKATT